MLSAVLSSAWAVHELAAAVRAKTITADTKPDILIMGESSGVRDGRAGL